VNVDGGWSSRLITVTGPCCWWQTEGRVVLLEIGDYQADTAQLVDPSTLIVRELISGERSTLGHLKYPDDALPDYVRELTEPIGGPDGRVLVGINFDVPAGHVDHFGFASRVAVLEPVTGIIDPVIGPFADGENEIERVHAGWSWNTPPSAPGPIVINESLLGSHTPARLDEDEPEEYAYWNLVALDYDCALLTGQWK
jgi:hypothetical protein